MSKARSGGGGGGGGDADPTSPISSQPRHYYCHDDDDDGVGVEGRQQDHPLLNGCILSNMFEVCPKGQLSNLRLVCKSWHVRSLSRFRKSATVSRDLSEDFAYTIWGRPQPCFVSSVTTRSGELAVELDPGLMEKYNLNESPFRNFRFCSWDIHSKHLGQSFWSNCGAWMRSLSLDRCRILAVDVAVFDQLLFERIPSLEVLKLGHITFAHNCYRKYHADPKSCLPLRQHQRLRSVEISFRDPFEHVYHSMNILCVLTKHRFPNLKKLCVQTQYNESASDIHVAMVRNNNFRFLETLFKSMADIRGRYPSTLALTHLNISGLFYTTDKVTEISEKTAMLMEKLRWPLQSLSLDVGAVTEEPVLKKILASCSNTLVKLELNGTGKAPYDNFPFEASMPCLQVLKTSGPILPSIACLKHFPNLRVLKALPWKDGEMRMDPEDMNVALPHLVTFKCLLFHPGNASNMRILAKFMPNLEEISMAASPETFPELCSLWINSLRKLEISIGADVDEYVLTGIRKPAKLRRSQMNLNSVTSPNIKNLIHLQEFGLHKPGKQMQVFRKTERASKKDDITDDDTDDEEDECRIICVR